MFFKLSASPIFTFQFGQIKTEQFQNKGRAKVQTMVNGFIQILTFAQTRWGRLIFWFWTNRRVWDKSLDFRTKSWAFFLIFFNISLKKVQWKIGLRYTIIWLICRLFMYSRFQIRVFSIKMFTPNKKQNGAMF